MLDPFVTQDWVDAHRNELVLADVRFPTDGRSGREHYESGHLPGAVYIDLESVLSDPRPDASTGRHPLPGPARFARDLGEVGIGDGDTVVAYDDAGGVIAARLVWMLRALGHEAALLAEPRLEALERGPGQARARTVRRPKPWPADRLARIDEVAALPPGVTLVDARPAERFHGGPDPFDPRSGHIPGAINAPARDNPERVLNDLRAVVCYCGSGVTACYDLLVAERLGVPGRLYPGSWSEWSRDPTRPVA
jgi:thiosulfate/3-mercaptopyruvate sulfurtransferase